MGYTSLQWNEEEVSNFSTLEEHLITTCETMWAPINIVNERGKMIGQSTRYDFDDLVDVILYTYNDRSGKIIVIGQQGTGERLEDLSRIMDFKRVRKN